MSSTSEVPASRQEAGWSVEPREDGRTSAPQPSLFISYAHKQRDASLSLKRALEHHGIRVRGDWDLTPGTDYQLQLEERIRTSDGFVFLITPDSLASGPCLAELGLAERLGKRLIPVAAAPVTNQAVPPSLSRPHWAPLPSPDDAAPAAAAVVDAVRTDFDHVVGHTQLTLAAEAWKNHGGQLLRGRVLARAEQLAELLMQDTDSLPKLSPLQAEFLAASRAVTKRQFAINSAIAGFIIVTVGLLASLTYQQNRNARTEEHRRHEEQAARLALTAQPMLRDSPDLLIRSTLLSMEALKLNPSMLADSTLRESLALLPRSTPLASVGRVRKIQFTPRGRYLLVLGDSLRAWETNSWRSVTIPHPARVQDFAVAPAGDSVAVLGRDGSIEIVALDGSSAGSRRLGSFPGAAFVRFSRTGKHVIVVVPDNTFSPSWAPDIASNTAFVAVLDRGSGHTRVRIPFSVWNDFWLTADEQKLEVRSDSLRTWSIADNSGIGTAALLSTSAISNSNTRSCKLLIGDFIPIPCRNTLEGVGTVYGEPVELAGVSSRHNFAVLWSQKGLAVHQLEGRSVGRELWTLAGASPYYAFSDDEQAIVVRGSYGTVYFREVSTGRDRTRITESRGRIEIGQEGHFMMNPVALSPDGHFLAVGSERALRIVSAPGFGPVLALAAAAAPVSSSFSGDTLFATGFADGSVQVGEVRTGKLLARVKLGSWGRVESVAFSADGKTLVAAFVDHTARVWRWKEEEEPRRLRHAGTGWINHVSFGPSDRYLATAGDGDAIRLWSGASGDSIAVLRHGPSAGENVLRLDFSRDGRLLATGRSDGTAALWSVPAGRQIGTFHHPQAITDLSFSPDGRYLATTSLDGGARLWRVDDGRLLFSLPLKFQESAYALAFSRDPRRLAVATGEQPGYHEIFPVPRTWPGGRVLIHHVPEGRRITELLHPATVWDVAFSPDGKVVASTAADGLLRVWDATTARELVRIKLRHPSRVVTFSPGGKYVAAAGEVHLWRAEDLIEEAHRRLPRALSRWEKRQYMGDG